MTRERLEHVIWASAAIGSQSVLGQFPDAPAELLVSREADVYPLRHPERGDLIDGSIGEGSPFERQFGYYAHGVARGWCLEVHDLAIAKYAAGREKDLLFTKARWQSMA